MILVCMHPICFDSLLYLAHFLSVYLSKYKNGSLLVHIIL